MMFNEKLQRALLAQAVDQTHYENHVLRDIQKSWRASGQAIQKAVHASGLFHLTTPGGERTLGILDPTSRNHLNAIIDQVAGIVGSMAMQAMGYVGEALPAFAELQLRDTPKIVNQHVRDALKGLHEAEESTLVEFSVDQPRDDHGRWTSGGIESHTALRQHGWRNTGLAHALEPDSSYYIHPHLPDHIIYLNPDGSWVHKAPWSQNPGTGTREHDRPTVASGTSGDLRKYLSSTLKKMTEALDDVTVLFETIVRVVGGYRIISHRTGKNLGTFTTRERAQRHLAHLARFRESRNPSSDRTLVEQPEGDLSGEDFSQPRIFPDPYPAILRRPIFRSVPEGQVAAMIASPLGGTRYANSFSDLGTSLLTRVRNILTTGLIQGQGVGFIGKLVQGALGGARFAAERIVRSEFVRTAAQADLQVYSANENALDGVQWVATLDDATCLQCGELDGEVYDSPDNAPVPVDDSHPACRCSIQRAEARLTPCRIITRWLLRSHRLPSSASTSFTKEARPSAHQLDERRRLDRSINPQARRIVSASSRDSPSRLSALPTWCSQDRLSPPADGRPTYPCNGRRTGAQVRGRVSASKAATSPEESSSRSRCSSTHLASCIQRTNRACAFAVSRSRRAPRTRWRSRHAASRPRSTIEQMSTTASRMPASGARVTRPASSSSESGIRL
jgi:SPP1 gp7 family putative phage head morphogenesis protein